MAASDPKRTLASPSRVTGVTEYRVGTAASLRLDVGRSDYLAPLLGFVCDKFSKVGGRHRHRRAAQIGKSCLDLGIGEGGIDFAVELIDDFSRRFLGCADTVPGGRLISRHKLSEGRNVWQRFRAHHGSYRERTQIAGPDVPD